MEDKHVFVIKNELEKYIEIFQEMKKNSPFNLEILDFDDFRMNKYSEILKENKQLQIIVVINDKFMNKVKDELKAHLNSLYKLPFRNIIIINPQNDYKTDRNVINGEHKIFLLYEYRDMTLQSEYFILFIIVQFNIVLMSYRVSDFISNSFKEVIYSELLKKKKVELDNLYKELEEKSKIDYLTKLYNRASIFEFLSRERDRALRDLWRLDESPEIKKIDEQKKGAGFNSKPTGSIRDHFGVYSLMMIDIDHFKAVNDNHGHLVGDKVLQKLGEYLVKDNIFRKNDIAGRFGGEEFIVVLPETNAIHSVCPAQRLCDEFKMYKFVGKNNQFFNVTLSIGISEFYRKDKKFEDIIQRADIALYYSKENGRDKITVYENITEYQKESK